MAGKKKRKKEKRKTKKKKKKKKKKKELGGGKSLAGGFIPTSQRRKGEGRKGHVKILPPSPLQKIKKKSTVRGGNRGKWKGAFPFSRKKGGGPLVPCNMTRQRAKIRRGEKMEQGVFSSPSIRETEVRRRRRTKNRSASLPPVKRELLQHQ